MLVSDNFIFSKSVADKQLVKYIRKINRGQKINGLMVIAINQSGKDLMEVLSLSEFYRSVHRGANKTIIGIAGSRDEAFECVGVIIQNLVSLQLAITKEVLIKEFRVE